MIRLKLPAEMSCDADGCTKSIDARLILLAHGGLGFAPLKGATWQVQMRPGVPQFITMCPEHSESIITPASPKRLITDAH